MRRKQWSDLTDTQKRGFVLLGALQLGLLITALIDIRRRPADAINGSKRLWTAVVFINGIGPIAYFLLGEETGIQIASFHFRAPLRAPG